MEPSLLLGTRVDRLPTPMILADTHFVEWGAAAIGVEYRFLNRPSVQDEGVSVHVCTNDAEHSEHLRFDLFGAHPHYHYVHVAQDNNDVVAFDAAAFGDMYEWLMESVLPKRLPAMLEAAGTPVLASKIDMTQCSEVLEQVRALVSESQVAIAK